MSLTFVSTPAGGGPMLRCRCALNGRVRARDVREVRSADKRRHSGARVRRPDRCVLGRRGPNHSAHRAGRDPFLGGVVMAGDCNVFLRAIEVLEERGWHQGGYEGAKGKVCLIGAINVVLTGDATNDDDLADVPLALMRATGALRPSTWNDDPSRTYEDVVLALKRAAHGEAFAAGSDDGGLGRNTTPSGPTGMAGASVHDRTLGAGRDAAPSPASAVP